MSKLNEKEKKRLAELRAKIIDENGDYRDDANFEDLQELAKLEAKADDKPEPNPIKPKEKQKPSIKMSPKKNAPKIVRPWLERGYDYYGVDEHGAHILYNKDEGMYYRLNKDPNFVDALAEGLPQEYLESLK